MNEKSSYFLFILQGLVRYISVMTQKDFTYYAIELRAKSVEIAERFGYAHDDAEDIAQDVMLRLWYLHERINDETHLKASATITAKRVCIDKWRTMRQHIGIGDKMPIVDADSLYDKLEYIELEHWLDKQIESLPSSSGMVLRMRQLEHLELSEIAVILGIKPSSVSTLLSRARRELFNKLKRRNQQ